VEVEVDKLSLLAVAIILMSVFIGCTKEVQSSTTTTPSTTSIKDFTDPREVINVAISEEFIITIDVDYQGITYDDNMLTLVESNQENILLDLETFYVIQLFKFKALKKGDTEIILKSLPVANKPDMVLIVNIK
jgi:hypothetical protein